MNVDSKIRYLNNYVKFEVWEINFFSKIKYINDCKFDDYSNNFNNYSDLLYQIYTDKKIFFNAIISAKAQHIMQHLSISL